MGLKAYPVSNQEPSTKHNTLLLCRTCLSVWPTGFVEGLFGMYLYQCQWYGKKGGCGHQFIRNILQI